MSKRSNDNRSNQLNPNNAAYWSSRGVAPPSTPEPSNDTSQQQQQPTEVVKGTSD